eukprot:1138103-Pelagomonas_calceolata.AAC.8
MAHVWQPLPPSMLSYGPAGARNECAGGPADCMAQKTMIISGCSRDSPKNIYLAPGLVEIWEVCAAWYNLLLSLQGPELTTQQQRVQQQHSREKT